MKRSGLKKAVACIIIALMLTPLSGCGLHQFIEAFDPDISAAPSIEAALPSGSPAGSPEASEPSFTAEPEASAEASVWPSPTEWAYYSAAPASETPGPYYSASPVVTPAPTAPGQTTPRPGNTQQPGFTPRPTFTPRPGVTPGVTPRPTPKPTVTPKPTQGSSVTTPKPEPLPTNGYLTDWERTRLVNFMHRLPDDYVPHNLINAQSYLGTLCGYHNTRARIQTEVAVQLKKMFEAAYNEGVSSRYYLQCAYRTQADQWVLWNNRLAQNPHYGDDPFTNPVGTMPGNASEHCAGLALDITSSAHTAMDYGFGQTAEGIWLRDNCHRFGFILRYPASKAHITGVHYESWHFRYVGVELARVLKQRGICLEEYYGEYNGVMPPATPTPRPGATPTPVVTAAPTATPAPTHTPAPTQTPASTHTPTPTPVPTHTPAPTPAPTAAPTATPAPTAAPTETPAPTEAPAPTEGEGFAHFIK